MIFYVSCRPLRYRKEIISPKECLKNNFTGLDIKFNCLGFNFKLDGRWLYEIEISDNYNVDEQLEYKDIILEALQPFACHIKTLDSAKILIEKITNSQWEIINDKLKLIDLE